MWLILLFSLMLSLFLSFFVYQLFSHSILMILNKLVDSEFARAYHRYLKFALILVGVSNGTNVYRLTNLMSEENKHLDISMGSDRFFLEIYQVCIETLGSVAWVLFLFFIVSLIAYLILNRKKIHENND